MANNLLTYSSKDYKSIYGDLMDSISALTNTWTSREEGDPGVVLIKLMSALGDMLSYNLDKQALEYYGPTVTQRKNAAKLFELIGYKMHWYRAAKTTLTVTNMSTMPEYITYYKRFLDGEDVVSIYIEYKTRYAYHDPGIDRDIIAWPPKVDENGNIILPKSMVNAGISRYILDITDEEGSTDPTNPNVVFHANNMFAPYAKEVYKFWQIDNTAGIHTYLADPQRTLSVYGRDSSALAYSLIPTTISGTPVNGEYPPTIELVPYVPTKLTAIQGSLRSITFTKNQLRDNCYYVPDADLDETYMYLSYVTTDNNNSLAEKTVFIEKTDNLLTVTDFENSDGTTKLYFEFKIDEFDYPYIELSSYWKEKLSEDAVTFTFYYFKTSGRYGNITSNYLSKLAAIGSNEIAVTNIENTDYVIDQSGEELCSPGYNPQTAADAYVDSLNYIMTYNTIVTIYDFARFIKRQGGVSNGFACDGQYANDLNKTIRDTCNAYSREQVLDILGSKADTTLSKEQLTNILYNIRKVTFDYRDACFTVEQASDPPSAKDFIIYGLNLFPIWENYETLDVSTGKQLAYYINKLGEEQYSPYFLYGIYSEDDLYLSDVTNNVQAMLDKSFRDVKIVSVKPFYAPCRVFPWRCCGTLHLTQTVTETEADNIVKNVVTYLAKKYRPENMEFGKKITYMELIDSVLQADSRIRYFDAGIGNRKLITYPNPSGSENFYNVEAYFNPISIMKYEQTYEEIKNPHSIYYNMICVDPSYIQKTGIIQ